MLLWKATPKASPKMTNSNQRGQTVQVALDAIGRINRNQPNSKRKIRLRGLDLQRGNLKGANLQGAHLQKANFEAAHLEGSNLTGVDLTQAWLFEASLACQEEAAVEMSHALTTLQDGYASRCAAPRSRNLKYPNMFFEDEGAENCLA